MRQQIVTIVLSAVVLMPISATGQGAPAFSGTWVLVTTTRSGTSSSGRSSAPATQVKPNAPPTVNTASGAAFNCGRQCTIVHKGLTLTVDNAFLGSDKTPAPAVTLELNGREMSVVDSFNPDRELRVKATWTGKHVEVISAPAKHEVNQSITLDAGQLVVVTSYSADPGRAVTLRYKKQ